MGLKIGNLETYGIIYKIENLVNGKVYIGQTTSKLGFNGRYPYKGIGIERVYEYHKWYSENGTCRNKLLYNSIKKYGLKNFKVYEIFDIAFSLEELNIKEEMWIKLYNSTDRKYGYNIRYGGDNYKVSEESNTKNGTPVVCINNHKIYKSMSEACEDNGINVVQLKRTLNEKRDKFNEDEVLFRIAEDLDYDTNYKRCSYCGKLFKIKYKKYKLKNGRTKRIKDNRNNYCDYCNSKNRKLQSGMIFKIKENNRNSMRLSDKTTKQKNYNRENIKINKDSDKKNDKESI